MPLVEGIRYFLNPASMKLKPRFTLLYVFIFLVACNENPPVADKYGEVHQYYLEQLKYTDLKVKELDEAVLHTTDEKQLQQRFKAARLAYKKAEFLAEYLSPEMAKVINGPAVPEVEEEDNVNTIIPPEGLQVIEGFLFPQYKTTDSAALKKETARLVVSMRQLIAISAQKQLSDSTVFKAFRKELFRSSVLGLAGYDAPACGNAIPEASVVWASFGKVISIYEKPFRNSSELEYNQMKQLVDSGTAYLQHHEDFNSFDRLHFLTTYANPLGKVLLPVLSKAGINISGTWGPVKTTAGSLFDEDAFLPDYYINDSDERLTKEKEILGRYLFFDPALSGNGQRSCASCHQPGKAFADSFPKSPAINGKSVIHRNTVTLLNAGLQPALFYDARVTYLEDQITDVLSNPDEMHGSMKQTMVMLRNSNAYMKLFREAFPQSVDPLTVFHVQNVIASYIRSLVSLNSPFDRYVRGDHSQLNKSEINGFNLYMGKAKCGTCHHAPLFNGSLPPDFTRTEVEVIGVPQAPGSKVVDADKGRYTLHPVLPYLHAFRTPTLRNVALTAPYMHNGVYYTLKDVIDFYNDGGGIGQGVALLNQTLPTEKLNLTTEEKQDIIAFLVKLTDTAVAQRLPVSLPALEKGEGLTRKINLYR